MSYGLDVGAIAAQRQGSCALRGGVAKRSRRRTTPSPANLAVLAYMRAFFAANGCLPTLPEIAGAAGWVGATAAHWHVAALVRMGYLEKVATRKWRWVRAVEGVQP